MNNLTRMGAAALVYAVSFSALAVSAPETLPETHPTRTIRFPAGNYGHVTLDGALAVTCSGWSREDTAAVFDISDPKRPRFLARFPAKGYSCAEPVFFGRRCYVPNGFCATVIDFSDRAKPRLEGYLNPRFPQSGCKRLWVEDGALFFQAQDGCYRVESDGFSFEKTDRKPPKPAARATDPAAGILKESCVVVGETVIPFVHSLSTLSVKDGAAYVYAPDCKDVGAQLLKLSPKAEGLSLFENRFLTAQLPRGNGFQTMGMQTAGCVTRIGDLFFVDDGLVRLRRNGTWETLLARTRPVSNASVDGTRIALTQCSRCRVLDFTDPANVRILDVAPKAELPLHVTGCHLSGDTLFVAYTLVERKGMDFIYSFPSKGYVASFDLSRPAQTLSTVETPTCIAIDRVGDFLYVSCRKGDFAVVDAKDPRALKLEAVRRDILDGDGYKVKTFEGRTYALNGRRILELDTTDPAVPQVKRQYARGVETAAPSYDDFTIDGERLYALAHASLDVFELEDSARTVVVKNTCGTNGVLTEPLKPADAAIFAGHRPNPVPPVGVSFQAGNFGNSFGAYVFDWVRLADGRYAVAYGEAGLVLCDAQGAFLGELPRGTDGWTAVFAAEVVEKDGVIYVKDGDGKVFREKSAGVR